MSIKSNLRHVAAAAALGLAGIGAAQANTIAFATAVGNQVIAGPAVIVSTTTGLFANPAGARIFVHFAAKCSVNAPAGNTFAYTEVDIQVLNAAGAVVATLTPTVGNLGAFCSADGSVGLTGWQSNAVIATGILPAGNYRVRAFARLQAGATQALYGERTLIVTR